MLLSQILLCFKNLFDTIFILFSSLSQIFFAIVIFTMGDLPIMVVFKMAAPRVAEGPTHKSDHNTHRLQMYCIEASQIPLINR